MMKRNNMMRDFFFIALILFVACQQSQLKPVELLPEDVCSFCKMAISEKRYAAEFITKDGDAFKFDDISCMAGYINAKKNRDSIAGFFVVDFNSKEWTKAEEAHFVKSSQFKTPMSGGIVAFKNREQAEATAKANQGKLLSFADVIGGK
jgi:copper chaperone NosL